MYALAHWLKERKIETVAMESTGVYWIPLFQILETQGFDVKLVNAHHVKTVPGRKSDVLDCQWSQQLHSYGLLSGSFRPDDQICVLRSYIRQRDTLIKTASTHVQRMQKALTPMNLQLHRVISDITGITGMAIIRAIVAGERNPQVLAALKNSRSALGAFYRRLRSRLGTPKAITATAHKIARLFYDLWTRGEAYIDPGVDYYEQKYQERLVQNLTKKAHSLGFELVPKSTLTADVS